MRCGRDRPDCRHRLSVGDSDHTLTLLDGRGNVTQTQRFCGEDCTGVSPHLTRSAVVVSRISAALGLTI